MNYKAKLIRSRRNLSSSWMTTIVILVLARSNWLIRIRWTWAISTMPGKLSRLAWKKPMMSSEDAFKSSSHRRRSSLTNSRKKWRITKTTLRSKLRSLLQKNSKTILTGKLSNKLSTSQPSARSCATKKIICSSVLRSSILRAPSTQTCPSLRRRMSHSSTFGRSSKSGTRRITAGRTLTSSTWILNWWRIPLRTSSTR